MVDLLEELEELGEVDEENFIYLNEQGKAELKQELVFKWNSFPSKKIHITCSLTDSISYVKTLLYVSLEKYSIFLGLKNLKIANLTNTKELLPEKGSIGDFIKNDTVFTFDVESSDMWLEVQIDYRDLALVIFFEVKVQKDTTILSLRTFVTELLNHILTAQNLSVLYEVSQISVQRVKFTEETILATDLKSSMVGQKSKVKKFKELNDEEIVVDVFTYINRYMICIPPLAKVPQNSKQRKSIIREAYNPTIMEVLQNVKFGFQVRAPRTEAKIMTKNHKALSTKRKIQVEVQKSEVCNCNIT